MRAPHSCLPVREMMQVWTEHDATVRQPSRCGEASADADARHLHARRGAAGAGCRRAEHRCRVMLVLVFVVVFVIAFGSVLVLGTFGLGSVGLGRDDGGG